MRAKVVRNSVFAKGSRSGKKGQTLIQFHDPTFKSKHSKGKQPKKKKRRK
jgi:hypothetical protein